jgi:HSP20 family protein
MPIGPCDYESWNRRVQKLLRTMGGPAEFETAGGGVWSPPTDVFETREGVVVLMELPGVSPEDVSLVLVDQRLVVRGQRKDPEAGSKIHYHQMEIAYGPFVKIVFLNMGYDLDGIRAVLADGYLKLTIPRAAKREKEKIAVEIRL